MGLREQIEAASAARAKTRRKVVPVPGGEVEVRGMVAGDLLRIGEEQNTHGSVRATRLAIALCCYEPGTDKQLWNPNDGPDLIRLSDLDSEIFDPLRDAAFELSGLAAPADPLLAIVESIRKEADKHRDPAVEAALEQAATHVEAAIAARGAEGNASLAPTNTGSSSSRASSGAAPRRSGAKR